VSESEELKGTQRPFGKRNPDAVIEARQKRLYKAQLSGLPCRQLVLEHAERESIAETTAWRDWRAVCAMNQQDFELERETILARLMSMRFRAVNQALRKNQLTSAAQLMDAIGRAAGEGQQALEINVPNLNIKIED
jgi:hypothetical protein